MSFAGEDAKQSIPPYQRKPYDGGYPTLQSSAPSRSSRDLIVRSDASSEISSEYFSVVHIDDEDDSQQRNSASAAVEETSRDPVSRLHSETAGERHDDVKRSRSTPQPEVQVEKEKEM